MSRKGLVFRDSGNFQPRCSKRESEIYHVVNMRMLPARNDSVITSNFCRFIIGTFGCTAAGMGVCCVATCRNRCCASYRTVFEILCCVITSSSITILEKYEEGGKVCSRASGRWSELASHRRSLHMHDALSWLRRGQSPMPGQRSWVTSHSYCPASDSPCHTLAYSHHPAILRSDVDEGDGPLTPANHIQRWLCILATKVSLSGTSDRDALEPMERHV